MSTIVAVPSESPGGLDAALGAHFGHCELYTLITLDDGQVAAVNVIPNVPHEQGGCMAPVSHLAQNRVRVLLAGGMGMRPLMGFQQMGIQVFHCGPARTVGEAVQAFSEGCLPEFGQQHTCGGGGFAGLIPAVRAPSPPRRLQVAGRGRLWACCARVASHGR